MAMTSHVGVGDGAILIVEDDLETAQIFGIELRAAGYEVQMVRDAEAALAFLDHAQAKVALIDLHLPTADGLQLVERLRARPDLAAMPIALMTGDYNLDDQTATRVTALDARLFFKPIWLDDLLNIVGDLLSHRSG
jgi:DNA-binding response OmpR family regulator